MHVQTPKGQGYEQITLTLYEINWLCARLTFSSFHVWEGGGTSKESGVLFIDKLEQLPSTICSYNKKVAYTIISHI